MARFLCLPSFLTYKLLNLMEMSTALVSWNNNEKLAGEPAQGGGAENTNSKKCVT